MSDETNKEEIIETKTEVEAPKTEVEAPKTEAEAPRAEVEAPKAEAVEQRSAPASGQTERPRQSGGDHEGPRHSGPRMPRFKKKGCRFCQNKNLVIDYKSVEVLERFITDRGKILPRRITGTCSKHQRAVARAIKQARIIALMPFVLK